MKNIILIEDRPGRQSQFLNNKEIEAITSLPGITVPKESECRNWINKIKSGDLENLKNYNLIIIHRSSLDSVGLKNLNSVCKTGNIDLVLFSGGLSQALYQVNGYQCLSVNSKDFYSSQLYPFLENYVRKSSSSLLELIHGDKWKLELLMRFRMLKTKLAYEENLEVQIRIEDELKNMEGILKIDSTKIDFEINKIITAI